MDERIFQKKSRNFMKLYACGLILFCIFVIQTGSASVFLQDGSEIPVD
jgi:hypothetical protein